MDKRVLGYDIVAALAGGMSVDPRDAARRQRLRERVLAAASGGTCAPADVSVRADGGEWHRVLPGLQVKPLHRDRASGSLTALWRLAAGASIPPHRHRIDEECLVLEGSISLEGSDYGVGDFMLAASGSEHARLVSRDGALLMIRGEDPFAMVARNNA